MDHYSKTDIRYWEGKVAFQTPKSKTYSVQIQHDNRRSWIGLGTANKEQAATAARNLYEDLRANGWEIALAKRKGAPVEKKVNVTIGEYLEAVAAKSLFSPKTLQSYAQALRKIAGDITGAVGREKRDAIKLRTLTPEKIEDWRIEFIRRKATDPLREKSARISVGSFILRARSLFSVETVARIRDLVEIPERLPFSGIKVETVHGPRYRATFDMVELLESARAGTCHRTSRAIQDLPSGGDGRPAPQRNRRAALDRVPMERRRDPHRDNRALSSKIAQFGGRRARGP